MSERTNTAKWLEQYNRWQINVQKNGVRRTFTSSTPGRNGQREANAKADAWLAQEKDERQRLKVTVIDAHKEWIDGLKLRTGKSHWRKAEERTNKYFIPLFGHYAVKNLTESDLQRVIDNAYSTGSLAHKTLENLRGDLSNFLKYCRKARYTTLRPEDIEIPRGAKRSEKAILPPDDVSKVFSTDETIWRGRVIKDRLIHAYRLAIVTGIRPGELLALERRNVAGEMIRVSRAMNDLGEITSGKNDNAKRTMMKTAQTTAIIADQLALLDAEGNTSLLLFPSASGELIPQKTFRAAWYRFCEHNSIAKVTPYELRHTFVSATKKMPDGLKKMVVGHSKNMDTEGVYGHEMEGDLSAAAAYIEAAFNAILSREGHLE